MIEFASKNLTTKALLRIIGMAMFAFILTGCGLFGPAASPTEVPPTRVPVPTFTPTVESAAPAPQQAEPQPQPAQQEQPVAAATDTPVSQPPTEAPPTEAPPTATAEAKPQVIVSQAQVNVRSGPGTTYGLAGTVNQNERYDVVAKNPDGDWWKVCCVNGQQVWIYGPLVTAENIGNVAVDTNIPAPPVVVQPTQPPVAAAPPTNTPPPPPPAASDPCASIGGDGCKFKLKSGPTFAGNGGNELKLQLFFIHSGIEGGQPQGSYFVAMFKDGQKLPIPDSVRSVAKDKNNGTLGPFNYEYTLQLSQIPGGSLAGNYSIFVLDGNGERDSKDFSFSIPDGQGQVYIVFDQG